MTDLFSTGAENSAYFAVRLIAFQVSPQMSIMESFSKENVTANDFDIQNMISSGSYAKTHRCVLNCAVKRAGW